MSHEPHSSPPEPESPQPEPTPLTHPRDGTPDVVDDQARLEKAANALAHGTGPVAVDAERASGYRYGQRAYLIQLRREGAGTWLIDPLPFADLALVQDSIGDAEWILHAATQDLPCLHEIGLAPKSLFDTELGARIAGLPKVGLAAVVEHYLGMGLAKEHSAQDWSQRPLPQPWLHYAALDVELLIELREAMAADLTAQGKWEWARQDFDALIGFTGPDAGPDPWRRTSGMHRIRSRRGAALVKELWHARDAIAQQRDIAPGRVLPDATIIDLAQRAPQSRDALLNPKAEKGATRRRRAQAGLTRHQREWLAAIKRARDLSEDDLPQLTRRSQSPPPPRAWLDKDPTAAARLTYARDRLQELSEARNIPVENLLLPDSLRRILWWPPAAEGSEWSQAQVKAELARLGVRDWQQELVTAILVEALQQEAPPEDEDA